MSVWVYLPDGAGKHYYADLTSGATTWERPAELDASPSAAAAVTPRQQGRRGSVKTAKWVEYMDETHGQPYFYNEVTGETAWFIPADDDDDIDDDEAPAVETSSEEAAKEAAKAEKRAARRLKILEEILSTEESYVGALRTLGKVYVEPLRMVADVPEGKKGRIFTHAELDAIFLNITVITKVNEKFLEELEVEHANWPAVNYAPIINAAAKQFKGCYTRYACTSVRLSNFGSVPSSERPFSFGSVPTLPGRYVNNFDEAAAKLLQIGRSKTESDVDKSRYLTCATKHPDARGLDLRSFLIQPVQRVPRYRMLLEDLLAHTPADHPETDALREALDRVGHVHVHVPMACAYAMGHGSWAMCTCMRAHHTRYTHACHVELMVRAHGASSWCELMVRAHGASSWMPPIRAGERGRQVVQRGQAGDGRHQEAPLVSQSLPRG